MTRGHVVLADGTVFPGRSVGADGVAIGEVVFNTAMSGYQEICTDPSYAGQIVAMTTPHVGNYGTNPEDAQATRPACAGFLMRAMSRKPSSWRSDGDFAAYLREAGVVALTEVDTRRLTRHIRAKGAMPAAVGVGVTVDELTDTAAAARPIDGVDIVSTVTTDEPYVVAPERDPLARVVAYDLGIKRDLLGALTRRGCEVHVVPARTPPAAVLELDPDGVLLSNGPGDPEPLTEIVAAVRALLGRVPVFGVCLGHQVIGLALGASTFKLAFGHHGGNHPVRRLEDGTVAITAQNHGFAVDLWSLTDDTAPERRGLVERELLPGRVETRFGDVVPTHQNLNDGTLEGLVCRDVPAFSVQYHPEAAPGPNDATGLFDRFVAEMGGS